MITFHIIKDVNNDKDDVKSVNEETIECSMEDSILSLKRKIIERFNLKGEYVDIDFMIERPIRELGKFNLEKGMLPRTLDLYTFDRYGLEGRTVKATFHEVAEYKPIERTSLSGSGSGSGKYNPLQFKKDMSYLQKDELRVVRSTFNIDSDKDFPSLS